MQIHDLVFGGGEQSQWPCTIYLFTSHSTNTLIVP